VRAALGVDALGSQPQPLHGPPGDQVLVHNLFGILRLHMPVPDRLGVDHHRRTVLALVQASRLVDADRPRQSGGFGEHLQLRKQVALAIFGAGRSRRTLRTNILTDKHVAFK